MPAVVPHILPGPVTVTMPGVTTLQVPPAGVLFSVVHDPIQIPSVPVIAPGVGVTVTTVLDVQPLAGAYIIVVVPGVRPVTIPEPDTVATAILELLQPPPNGVLVSVIVLPAHTVVGPPIAPAAVLTVTTAVVIQPPDDVYVIVAVPGAGVEDTPITTPVVDPTDAIAALLLLHVPPGVAELSVVVLPWHIVSTPVIFAGIGNTVKVIVAIQPPGVV